MTFLPLFSRSKLFLFLGTFLSAVIMGKASAGETNCVPPPFGLVSWWRAENDASDQVGGNNGVLTNNVGFEPGMTGEAFSLGGTNGIVVPDSPSLNFGPGVDFSIEAWIKPAIAVTDYGVMDMVDKRIAPNLTQAQGYAFSVANGQLGFQISDSLDTGFINVGGLGPDMRDGNWHHVAVTVERASPTGLRLYVDGQVVCTADPTSRQGDLTTPQPLLIGLHPSAPWFNGNYTGDIDEVSLYRRALAPAEIQAIYTAGGAGKCVAPAPPFFFVHPTNQAAFVGGSVSFSALAGGTPPLIYQWLFNGTNLAGAVASSLTLTNVQLTNAGIYALQVSNSYGSAISSNAVLTVNPPPPCIPAAPGLVSWWRGEDNAWDQQGGNHGQLVGNASFGTSVVGEGFVFDGSADAVQVGNPANLQLQDFSIEAWVKRASTASVSRDGNGNGSIFSYGQGGYGFYLDPSGYPALTKFGFSSIVAPTAITDTGFHHVAVTKTGSQVVFYIDGAAYPVAPFDPGFLFTTTAAIGGGGNSLAYTFWGTIDELSVFSRALLPAEVQGIYQASVSGKCAVPVAPFILVQPTDQTVFTGGGAAFSVRAGGTPPLSYQWNLSGTNLDCATNAVLVLTNIEMSQAGPYSVLVTNVAGSALSSNALLTANPPPPCSTPPIGLAGWWRGENNVADAVGSNGGTMFGRVAYTNGLIGKAFVFDGITTYAVMPDAPNLRFRNAMTLEMWIYPHVVSVASRDRAMVEKWEGGVNQRAYSCSISGAPATAGKVCFLVSSDGGSVNTMPVYSASTVPTNQWTHVAAVYDGSFLRVYLNGALENSVAWTKGIYPGTASLVFGSSLLTRYFYDGYLDEVSLYARALDAEEIQAIYSAGISGKCASPVPPFIFLQPLNQTVTAGTNVTFVAAGVGTIPLSYQWTYNGDDIPGANSASLTLPVVQVPQSGNYTVRVTNVVGVTSSSNAVLVVNYPPAVLRLPATNVTAGALVTLPVVLGANGNENTLAFSLNFDPTLLNYTGTTLGNGAPGGVLIPNLSLLGSGKLGLSVALPPGTTFSPGPQEVLRVGFAAAIVTNAASSPIVFADRPTVRLLADGALNPVPAFYSNGVVSISAVTAFEGDVFPPRGGDQNLAISDWLFLGRYVARLDYPTNAAEFQRADCAPRSTLGDGAITTIDWVQAGRFASGLDPLVPSGGPTAESPWTLAASSATRLLTVSGAEVMQGEAGDVSVALTAEGNENALAFSLSFDPAQIRVTGVNGGADVAGATLYINTNQAAAGRVAVAMALGPGSVFAAGRHEVAQIAFLASDSGSAYLSFSDQPVPREISDTTAASLPVGFNSNPIMVIPPPALGIAESNQTIMLSWPLWATNFVLQEAIGALPPASAWTNIPVQVSVTNNQNSATLPLDGSAKFYRLYRP